MAFSDSDRETLLATCHGDPFAVLGPHLDIDGIFRIRAFQPGAAALDLMTANGEERLASFELQDAGGLFELSCEAPVYDYRFSARWHDGGVQVFDDPYRHPALIDEADLWWLSEGTHLRPYRILGAEPTESLAVSGTRFAVWAPHAGAVGVIGDFNFWDGRRHPMRRRHDSGVWELFIPGIDEGALYKFAMFDPHGRLLGHKADPYARRAQLRPATASIVTRLPTAAIRPVDRAEKNAIDVPISIYEVHLGSWRSPTDPTRRFADWDELAATLVPYVRELGFTHVELLPITEHPLDASWGYQPTGLYAPSARYGEPAGFARFVAACHQAGLGVILDWVPGHFPADAHGLAQFDGTPLYEYGDPREGFHPDWKTLIPDFSKPQVRSFLIGSALYWIEVWGVDGLRIDAVASMLYRDYSRGPGEWLPNMHGGRENLEAIEFLRRLNTVIGKECPHAMTIAEESTAFPGVSRPVDTGGLGFHYKWNMGWMNDTLRYIARDPVHRQHHHDELTFGLLYAFSEQFVLPISHDEVVHGKGSLLGKMPGDRWQRFANLRAYLGFMFAHPGKKLLFMGCEIAQLEEWNHDGELNWALLEDSAHAGVQRLVRDLNALLRRVSALHNRDCVSQGFEWLVAGDLSQSVFAFLRHGRSEDPPIVVVCHFTPMVRADYRLGVPMPGVYRECLNTDSEYYGGSNCGTTLGMASSEPIAAHGHAQSIVLRLPPLATVFLERV